LVRDDYQGHPAEASDPHGTVEADWLLDITGMTRAEVGTRLARLAATGELDNSDEGSDDDER
jgi:hypothetical protein